MTDEFDRLFAKVRKDVDAELARIGSESVEIAKARGNYKDNTGHLRASNRYTVENGRLTIENTAEYAALVEARGYDVMESGFIHAKEAVRKLKV